MLPDLPAFKHDFNQKLRSLLKQRVNQHMGIFGTIKHYLIKEGDKNIIHRSDGDQEETEITRAESGFTIPLEMIPTLSIQERIDILEKSAQDMAEQISRHGFSVLNRTLTNAGQQVDGHGGPLTAELYLEAIRKIEIDFDQDGMPHMPTLVIHPSMRERVQSVLQQFADNPDYRNQYKEMIEIKRQEWRAREASRKLVG